MKGLSQRVNVLSLAACWLYGPARTPTIERIRQMAVEEGALAPEFRKPVDGDDTIALQDLRGKKVVLYFYPKDDTSGCTKQACAFRDLHPKFEDVDAVVLGVSKDSVASHDKFRDKYDLPFHLVSDEEGEVCDDYGVWVEKSMYGRKYMGIERATFLIDEKGIVRRIWRKVKVPGHADAVMKAIREIDEAEAA